MLQTDSESSRTQRLEEMVHFSGGFTTSRALWRQRTESAGLAAVMD